MEKGKSSFSTLSHYTNSPAELSSRAFHADTAPLVAAILALRDKPNPEIKIDLPAMNPSFTPEFTISVPDQPAPVVNMGPISVTVPEFPEVKIPPIAINIPDAGKLEIAYGKIAAIACIPPLVYLVLQAATSALFRYFGLPG